MPLRFAPRWYWVLLTAALLPVFVSLGLWQWNRGQERQASWDEFTRVDAPAAEVGASQIPALPRYTRVRVEGRFDGERQFLLDNMSHRGAPGYQVLTVMELTKQTQIFATNIGSWVVPGLLCAALYLMMSLPLASVARRLEDRWRTAGA